MKSSAAAIAAPADAPSASRERYERCAFALYRRGHLPGVALSHLGFRLLLFFLGQRPGAYAAHYGTIAAQLQSNRDSIKREAHRLRKARLLRCELIPPHRPLPFRAGSYTRTNVLRFDVDVERLSALLEVGVAPSVAKVRPPTVAKPPPSTGAKPPPSPRTIEIYEPQPPSSKPPPIARGTEPLGGREAVSKETGGMETELEVVAQAWHRLGLGELGAKERKALENRRGEGASLDQLLDAVAGAAKHAWLRTGARSAFAVVFANLPAIARFAHDGRKLAPSTLLPGAELHQGSPPSLPVEGESRTSASLARSSSRQAQTEAAPAPAFSDGHVSMPAETRAALERLGCAFGAKPIPARSIEPPNPAHAWAPPSTAERYQDKPPVLPRTDFRVDAPTERVLHNGCDGSRVAAPGIEREGAAGKAGEGSKTLQSHPDGREEMGELSQPTRTPARILPVSVGPLAQEAPAPIPAVPRAALMQLPSWAAKPPRNASWPPPATHHATPLPQIRAEAPSELSRLFQVLCGHSARPYDPTETEHDRRRRAQAEFDRRRFELLNALRALEQ